MKKKGFKIEYLIYIYLVISPFLDAISCMYREWFPSVKFSPLMVIRPIIPIILLLYIFIKDKKSRIKLFILGLIYCIYGLIHLLIFKKLLTGISYGNIFTEALYIFNYTYMIFVLYIIMYFSKKNRLPELKKYLFYMLCSYLLIIYVSIITKTSLSTYVEGTGYRSWFVSGNTLCTVLILLFCLLIDNIFNSKKIINYLIFLLLGIYMIFLVGTRTGMLGFLIIFIMYLVLRIFFNIKKKIKFNKKIILGIIVILIVGGLLVYKVGSNTFERRKVMSDMEDDIIDINNNEIAHVTGDSMRFIYDIKNYGIDEEYISREQQLAYLNMYEFCNKYKIKSNNYRVQQLVYNVYLVREQANIKYILFGNGHVNQYGEMILEMELPFILLNFGIIGFIIYVGPLLYLLFKYIIRFKKKNINYYMYIFGLLIAFGLSCIAGYVLYSSTCVLVMICMLYLLENNGDKNEKKNIIWYN